MDPKNQPQFNPKIPISEVLKQEQTGYTPSVQKMTLNDEVSAIGNIYANDKNSVISKIAPTNSPISPTIHPPVPIRIVKTFRSDATEAAKTQHATVAKIAIAEEQQRRENREETDAVPKKKFGLLLITIILVIVGAVAIPTVQYLLNQKTQEVAVLTEKTIIPFDHEEAVILDNVTRDDLTGALNVLSAKVPVTSTIEYLKISEKKQDINKVITTATISPDTFAALIGPNMPSALARSFDSDYMYGIEDSKNPKPFILFKTSSYQLTYANMLRWETQMITDLSPILNLGIEVIGRPFTDQVINNKDVRAIVAPDGTILFLYGFLDNQTLIITTNQQTFQNINNKYIAARFVQ